MHPDFDKWHGLLFYG